MRRLLPYVLVLLAVSFIACAEKSGSSEKVRTYDLSGTIVGRQEQSRQLIIEHQDIGDWMKAMTMPFDVRGAEFSSLPSDGTKIKAKVHVSETAYWITDVVAQSPSGDAPQ